MTVEDIVNGLGELCEDLRSLLEGPQRYILSVEIEYQKYSILLSILSEVSKFEFFGEALKHKIELLSEVVNKFIRQKNHSQADKFSSKKDYSFSGLGFYCEGYPAYKHLYDAVKELSQARESASRSVLGGDSVKRSSSALHSSSSAANDELPCEVNISDDPHDRARKKPKNLSCCNNSLPEIFAGDSNSLLLGEQGDSNSSLSGKDNVEADYFMPGIW